jgi:GGDEF domain-containing protein
LLVSMTDITGGRAAEAELVHQGAHDSLTGLPSRSVLVERLRQLGRSNRTAEPRETAVFFLDLDDFKRPERTRPVRTTWTVVHGTL